MVANASDGTTSVHYEDSVVLILSVKETPAIQYSRASNTRNLLGFRSNHFSK